MVQSYGRVVVHTEGFRSQKARILGLVVPDNKDWRSISQVYGSDKVWVVPSKFMLSNEHLDEMFSEFLPANSGRLEL